MSGVKYKQMSESIWIWLSMAVVGGYLDAYTYIMRGNVFANTQTGNFVLFGMSIANRNWFNAMCYLLPIIAFGCGIMLSEVVKKEC